MSFPAQPLALRLIKTYPDEYQPESLPELALGSMIVTRRGLYARPRCLRVARNSCHAG